jgi:hypothetical protein
MMRMLTNFLFLAMRFLKKNQYFFLSRPNPVSSSISLPPFSDVSSTPSRFKPGIVS